jgi:hypothetical protein
MDHLYRDVMRYVNRLDTHEWTLVLLGVILIGFLCLRGFGSRSDY